MLVKVGWPNSRDDCPFVTLRSTDMTNGAAGLARQVLYNMSVYIAIQFVQ